MKINPSQINPVHSYFMCWPEVKWMHLWELKKHYRCKNVEDDMTVPYQSCKKALQDAINSMRGMRITKLEADQLNALIQSLYGLVYQAIDREEWKHVELNEEGYLLGEVMIHPQTLECCRGSIGRYHALAFYRKKIGDEFECFECGRLLRLLPSELQPKYFGDDNDEKLAKPVWITVQDPARKMPLRDAIKRCREMKSTLYEHPNDVALDVVCSAAEATLPDKERDIIDRISDKKCAYEIQYNREPKRVYLGKSEYGCLKAFAEKNCFIFTDNVQKRIKERVAGLDVIRVEEKKFLEVG